MFIKPNFTMVPKRITLGVYLLLLKKCETFTSQRGTQCLRWTGTIKEGEFQGRDLQLVTPTEGKGAGLLQDFLGNVDPSYLGGDFNTEQFLGKPLWVRVEKFNSAGYPIVTTLREYEVAELTNVSQGA